MKPRALLIVGLALSVGGCRSPFGPHADAFRNRTPARRWRIDAWVKGPEPARRLASLYNAGKYMEARDCGESMLLVDPYDRTAIQYLRLVNEALVAQSEATHLRLVEDRLQDWEQVGGDLDASEWGHTPGHRVWINGIMYALPE
ncbi:MAG: hypothetical protein HN742_11270 [Lentisphaerae bacterium]|nr:hypothetical protein [Lentisphaerota bacterium]MBT5606942.1 hypothetical protein [Lentisphaerota bacterium]MBT7055999.1 hypothetical protein [Lentisphaerota bacterium]MBT7842446.1 hypothetical protein [Lentisphaerota bacterium]